MGSPRITLDGNIAKAIEYRAVGNSGVARFRVMTNDRRKIDDEWTDTNSTGWNVEIWGNSAIKVRDHLEVGDPIVLEGIIFEDKWEDKVTGEPKSSMVIKADYIGLNVGKAKTN